MKCKGGGQGTEGRNGRAVAEAMVAGGVLMGGPDALARVRPRIRPAMFHDPRLAEVFRACADLADQGVPYDAGVVFAAADSDKVTAADFAALLDTVPTAANIEWHAERVVEQYARRKSLDVVRDLGDMLATSPPNGFVRTAVGRLEALHDLAVPRTEDAPATLADWWKADRPLPAPIIGREGQSGAVLVQGQAMLLSGAGGTGKSRAALQLALARGAAVASGQPWAVTMGLRVAAGPTVFASWEDVGEVAAVRSRNIVSEALASDDQRVFGVSTDGMAAWTPDPEAQPEIGRHVAYRYGTDPLFAAPDGWTPPAPTPAWDRLWRLVDDTAPDGGALVVLDPALGAFKGDSNDAGAVRGFMGALAREAQARDASVLIVGHSNRAGRRKAADDVDLHSGSAAWSDRARGVLALTKRDGGPRNVTLRCLKANYGAAFWSVNLFHLEARFGLRVDRSK